MKKDRVSRIPLMYTFQLLLAGRSINTIGVQVQISRQTLIDAALLTADCSVLLRTASNNHT